MKQTTIKMKKIFLLTLVFISNLVFSQTKTQVFATIDSNIYSNTTHKITGDALNYTLKRIAQSSANLLSNIATSSTNGILTSTDWTIFNNKQSALPKATAHVNGYLDTTDFQAFSGTQTTTGALYFAKAATTSSLAVSYSSGTITATSNGRLANQDGIKLTLFDKWLVKNNSATLQNGLYVIYDTGTTSSTFKAYRDSSYNETSEIYPSQINVLSGTVNGGGYFLQTTVDPVVGTDPIVYTSIPAPASIASQVSFVDVVLTTPLPNSPVYTSGSNTLTPGQNATYKSSPHKFPTLNGVAPFVGMKVLVMGQADSTKNGDYILTDVGNTLCPFCWPWVLQRISYTSPMFYPHLWEVTQGTNKGEVYQQNNASLSTSSIGTSGNITFTKISPASTPTITLTGDVTGVGTNTIVTTLSNSGISAGTYSLATVTFNSKGVATSASNGSINSIAWSLNGNSGTTPGTNFLGTTDNKPLVFKTNNTERVRLDSLGNLGVGTSIPASTDAISIVGNNSLRKSVTLQNTNALGAATYYLQNDVGNFNSYGGLLHAGSSFGGNFFGISGANKTVLLSDGASSAGFMIGTLVAQPLIFGTNNTEQMRILSGGNIGIGVTNPLAKLHISGSAYISNNVAIGTTTPDPTDAIAVVGNNGVRLSTTMQNTSSFGNTSVILQNDRGGYNSYVNLLQGGSAYSISLFGLSCADKTVLLADGANSTGMIIGTLQPQPLIFGTNNTEQMRILSSGNVGIGTASPSVQFHTTGGVRFQGLSANTYTNVVVIDNNGNLATSITYPTAWSTTTTITIGAQTTAPTKATTVQNDFVRYRISEPAIGSNTELIEVDYEYSATSNTGTAGGNGNYLFTLPNGYQFNSTEHPIYTGTNVLAGGSLSIYAIDRGKPQGMVFGDGFYDMVLIIPYSTTQFRVMPIGGNAPNAWVGSGWYPITQNTKVMSFKFKFYKQ